MRVYVQRYGGPVSNHTSVLKPIFIYLNFEDDRTGLIKIVGFDETGPDIFSHNIITSIKSYDKS